METRDIGQQDDKLSFGSVRRPVSNDGINGSALQDARFTVTCNGPSNRGSLF
jgi:hypothetical protein